jgi:hypothetical protein
VRIFVVTEEEMAELIDDLTIEKLKANNIADPYRQPHLTPTQIDQLRPFVDSIHRGFHMVAYRWAQKVGFEDVFKKLKHH